MTKLTAKKRDALPASEFGIPGERKYPMPDEVHARDAKARASAQEHAGKLTATKKATIDRKADRLLDQQ